MSDDKAIYEIVNEWCGEGTIGVMRHKIVEYIATIRQEERRAAWGRVFDVISSEGSFGARQLIKSLEAARETDGCGPVEAAASENRAGENHG